MHGLESLKYVERLGRMLQVAQRDGRHVEHIAMVGHLRQKSARQLKCRRELTTLEQFANAANLGLDTCVRFLKSALHNPSKKSPGAIFDIAPAMAQRVTAMDGGHTKKADISARLDLSQ
jgi:hypothetical protein